MQRVWGSKKIMGAQIYFFLKKFKINWLNKLQKLSKNFDSLQKIMSASNPLSQILEINRLTRPNFKDWLQKLKIILSFEKIGYVLDQDLAPLPTHPTADQRASIISGG